MRYYKVTIHSPSTYILRHILGEKSMVTKKVSINSMEKLQSFVNIVNGFSGRFDLCSGSSCVNARSMMGIFSLDISRPLDFYIYNDEHADYVVKAISAYLVSSCCSQEH